MKFVPVFVAVSLCIAAEYDVAVQRMEFITITANQYTKAPIITREISTSIQVEAKDGRKRFDFFRDGKLTRSQLQLPSVRGVRIIDLDRINKRVVMPASSPYPSGPFRNPSGCCAEHLPKPPTPTNEKVGGVNCISNLSYRPNGVTEESCMAKDPFTGNQFAARTYMTTPWRFTQETLLRRIGSTTVPANFFSIPDDYEGASRAK